MTETPPVISKCQLSYPHKLMAIFTFAIIAIGIILDLAFINIQKKEYTKSMKNSGFTTAQLLSQSITLGVFSENENIIAGPVETIISHSGIVEITIFNNDGDIIISRQDQNNKGHSTPKESYQFLFDQAKNNGKLFWDEKDKFIFWWPVQVKQGSENLFDFYSKPSQLTNIKMKTIGFVSLVISKRDYNRNINKIISKTAVIIAIAATIVLLIVIIILRKMSQPLIQLINKLSQFQEKTDNKDDISFLTNRFDDLIAELDQAFETINDLNNELEERVEDRTQELVLANNELTKRQKFLKTSNDELALTLEELQKAHVQLIQSEKMAALGQVVAGVAHEINNNITFISGTIPSLERSLNDLTLIINAYDKACGEKPIAIEQCQVAQDNKENLQYDIINQELSQLLGNIKEGVSRTKVIIKDLSVFSRKDGGDHSLTDLNTCLNSTIKFLDFKRGAKIEVVKNFSPLTQYSCSPGKMSQVFLNIMNNSIYAMKKDGGQLIITTWQDDKNIHITITDTGTGIPTDILPKIFDLFFTTKPVGDGTGLGLGISYEIIKEHRGVIEVQTTENKGSTFEVMLPLGPET